jgi:hypothetical protein
MEPTFSPQLGPFYESHGAEIIPCEFEEAMERMTDTLGTYEVRSNLTSLPDRLDISPYELTKYIQEEWDRLTGPQEAETEFPRRGFLLSSRSPSHAAGRAAEEIVLAQLLWQIDFGTVKTGQVYWFYDALDQGLVCKPSGVGCDDYLVQLTNGTYLLVEVKASLRGKPDRFITKAIRQLRATSEVNPAISHIAIALIDLAKKTVRFLVIPINEIDRLAPDFQDRLHTLNDRGLKKK